MTTVTATSDEKMSKQQRPIHEQGEHAQERHERTRWDNYLAPITSAVTATTTTRARWPPVPATVGLNGSSARSAPCLASAIGGDGSNTVATSDAEATSDEEPCSDSMPLPLPPPPPRVHWPHICSAIGAGIITAVFTSPLDVIRTRLAVQQNATVYHGLIGSARVTWNQEGLRGMYRGFGPTIIVVPAFWAIYFTCYSDLKERFNHSERVRHLPTWSKHLLAACSAGAVADVLVNPLFVARTRMQTQHMRFLSPAANPSGVSSKVLYTGTLNTLVRLVREEGPLSLMRGVSASLLGLTHVCIQFPLYEYLKIALPAVSSAKATGHDRWMAVAEALASANPVSRTNHERSQHHIEPSMWHLITASAMSKMIASVLTFPHEVLRSRLQNAPASVFNGLRDCASKTVRLEGFKALYNGLGVNLIRTVPGCVLTFVSYEVLLKNIQDRAHHK